MPDAKNIWHEQRIYTGKMEYAWQKQRIYTSKNAWHTSKNIYRQDTRCMALSKNIYMKYRTVGNVIFSNHDQRKYMKYRTVGNVIFSNHDQRKYMKYRQVGNVTFSYNDHLQSEFTPSHQWITIYIKSMPQLLHKPEQQTSSLSFYPRKVIERRI